MSHDYNHPNDSCVAPRPKEAPQKCSPSRISMVTSVGPSKM